MLDPAGALHTSLYWFGGDRLGWRWAWGIVFLLVNQWLKSWSHGANDAANHPTLATDHGEP